MSESSGPRPSQRPDRRAFDATVDALGRHVAAVFHENQQLQAALADAQARNEAYETELKQLRETAAAFDRTADELRADCTHAVIEHAERCTVLPLDGLLTAFAGLERATGVSEVLECLVTALAREFSRVALFDVRGDRLEMVRGVGFDTGDNGTNAALPRAGDSLVARASRSATMEVVVPGVDDPRRGILLGGTPSCAIAIPLAVGRGSVAVVYADDSDVPEFSTSMPQARIKFADLLRLHTNLLLQREAHRGALPVPLRAAD